MQMCLVPLTLVGDQHVRRAGHKKKIPPVHDMFLSTRLGLYCRQVINAGRPVAPTLMEDLWCCGLYRTSVRLH